MSILSTRRRYIYLSWLLILQLCWSGVHAQGLSAVLTSTASICFDDGTLTITGSGGTAPYTMTLLSGPADPNITYPVVLASGLTTFGGLPHGSYTVEMTDAVGDTATFTGTVGGTYQFPSLSFTISPTAGVIVASESGGHGPFSYAISSTGSNTGFGPFQASDTFTQLCPGFYWIRVIDSCGNIYTNEITYHDSIIASVNCINFSKGTLDATATGGNPPYTYTMGASSNTTGSFTGLPAYFSDTLVITDACGQRITQYIPTPVVVMQEHCPSDSIIYLSGVSYPYTPDTLTFICTNCTPAQTVTRVYDGTPISADTLFMHQPQGTHYNVVVLSSACGGDTLSHAPPAISNNIMLNIQFLSCKSFQASVSNNGLPVAVDSFVLSYVVYGPTIEANTTGLFEKLPDSMYVLTAYIGSLCGDTPRAFINIPYFPRGCYSLMMDASCHSAWEYSLSRITNEVYSVIFPPHDTIAEVPNHFTNSNFYDLAPGTNYTLISDSGCSETLHTPLATPPLVTVSAYLPCVGQPVITFTGTAYTYCDGSLPTGSVIRIKVTYKDSTIYNSLASTDTTVIVDISGSGRYFYRVYAVNLMDSSPALRFDTICAIDTGSIYMDNTQIPYLLSSVALVCDSATIADSVSYQVYGGSIPYTVEIPGFDTVILHGNVGMFPTRQPGTYTMIVYDNCGISRSMTFAIVDTCSNCPYAAITLPDTLFCAGDTVHLVSGSIHAQSYQWYVNGQPYSTAADTLFISGAGGNNITLIVVSSTGCADTAYAHTSDTCRGCPHVAIAMPDSVFCPGDTVHLVDGSIGGVAFRWYLGGVLYSTAEDTIYIASATGNIDITLLVTSATACTDSAHKRIQVLPKYLISLPPDTVYCGPFSRVLNTGVGITTWSTGQIGSLISVDTAGTYVATASNLCGTSTAAITIREKPLPVLNLGPDTLICQGNAVTLNAGNPGSTYLWSTGATTQAITTSATGLYQVTVTHNGCSASDARDVKFIHAPSGLNLGNDTTLCSGHPYLLMAYQPYAYSTWNTGSVQSFIYVDTSGTYIVTDSNACGKATDSITIVIESCSCDVIIPTAFSPNHDGLNDKYGGTSPCTPSYYLFEVFDRWGQKMFHSEVITDWWDGTYKNVIQPLGVYVWYMKFVDPYTGIQHFHSGNVTLLR